MKKITVSGQPTVLRRHRHTKSGITYNSQRKEMDDFSFEVKTQWNKTPYDVPLKVSFSFFMAIPKSKSRKLNGLPYVSNKDLSNMIKFAEDSLNGVVWADDRYIVEISAIKIYSDNPRTEIKVELY